jgi:hypothetical protein
MKATESIPRGRLVWLAMATLLTRQTTAVPVPPLGIDRRLDKGARRGGRLRPPLIGASVAHRNSHANKLLDIAQGGHLLAVAQRGDFNGFYFVVNGTPRLGGAS